MKYILLAVLVSSCYTTEIQVKSTWATVIEVTTKQWYGYEDMAVFHLRSANGIPYMLERPLCDTAIYLVGKRYPFLSPK